MLIRREGGFSGIISNLCFPDSASGIASCDHCACPASKKHALAAICKVYQW